MEIVEERLNRLVKIKVDTVKTITIEVPDWIDEKKLREAITKAISEVLSRKEMTIDEIRKILGIRPENLTEELEVIDVKKLREKEKDRLKW